MSKKPTKQELIDHVESLVAKCAELTRERDEANKRIRQLLGDTEQLKLTVARLTEDLRRMDAITNILYVSIEKRKLREGKQL